MRTLTDHEKRTVRFAAIGIAIYLALFGGWRVWKYLENKRSEYQQFVQRARTLRREIQSHTEEASVAKKLMEEYHMDPAKLTRASVVAEASAAIQKAATTGGMQVGPIRESPGRPASKELASMQFEGTGPVPALMGLLYRLERLVYPLVIDSVQITPETMKPGQARLNLTIVILDFDQWKTGEAPHA